MKIYEFKIADFTPVEIDEKKPEELQKEGWELCGPVTIDTNQTWCGSKSIRIPFRREVTEQIQNIEQERLNEAFLKVKNVYNQKGEFEAIKLLMSVGYSHDYATSYVKQNCVQNKTTNDFYNFVDSIKQIYNISSEQDAINKLVSEGYCLEKACEFINYYCK